jgi:hypothetical protein
MKTFLILVCSLCLAVAGFAQAPVAQGDAPRFTSEELDQLLGPIALYPDPLIALILPASTVPSDIVLADRFVTQGGDPAQVANQPWDDSVKGLTHYPNLLKWLDQNLDWTTQLGTAYLAQPGDVMDAIQQLRAEARANGSLMNTDQQQVVVDNGDIAITPTDPNTIYMPLYDPDAVYDSDYTLDDGPLLTFDGGYPVGPWLYYWPDWRHRGIYIGDWNRWKNGNWRPGYANGGNARPWRSNPGSVHAQYNPARTAMVRPQTLPGISVIHAKQHSGVSAGVVSAPQRDFTGRGGVVPAPGQLARPVVSEPPAQSAFTGYGRGSDARAASERGQFSRQFAAPAAPAYHPSAPSFSRPASGGSGGGGGGRFGR